MSKRRIIYSERCWYEGKLQPASVVIEDGCISDVLLSKIEGAEDAGSAVVMPGVIDAHVHINEPGRTHWEGFETGTKSAAKGGISTVVDMPLNASPVTTNAAAFHAKLNAAKGQCYINVGFYGGLIPGNTNELEALIEEGVLGIKCFLVHSGIDEFPNVTEMDLRTAMPVIAKHKIPLLAHCELYAEEAAHQLEKFPGSYKEYLASRPRKWENDAVSLMVNLCREYHCPVHIVHVSSAEALDIIQKAKAEGLPVTAETCAHYIYFSAEQIADCNTAFKCAPPIREAANNELLKRACKTGVIDFLTTDHSPAPPEVKQVETGNFLTGWGGIAGLQFLLPASWTALKNILTLDGFIPLLTSAPAKFLGISNRKGKIEKGFDADIVIWNPGKEFTVTTSDILHKHKICPYNGERLTGTVDETIVNGITVYKTDRITVNEANGTFILHRQ